MIKNKSYYIKKDMSNLFLEYNFPSNRFMIFHANFAHFTTDFSLISTLAPPLVILMENNLSFPIVIGLAASGPKFFYGLLDLFIMDERDMSKNR